MTPVHGLRQAQRPSLLRLLDAFEGGLGVREQDLREADVRLGDVVRCGRPRDERAELAERVGLKPVVALGFAVYAVFPVVLIGAPANPLALVAIFAFSGLRFAGLPSHKALVVGPAEQGAGGRVTGSYYLLRNTIVIPSAAIGGVLWDGLSVPETVLGASLPFGGTTVWTGDPTVAFTVAAVVGVVGTGYFLVFGREFEAYA